MNAERLAPVLAVLLLSAGLATPATAQTIEDAAQDALAKGEQEATRASEDPQATAENATDPSWQGRQINWTRTWACTSAYAVDERVGELGQQATGCTPAEAVQAGQEEAAEQNEPAAEAEEADADAERAARDQVAAAEAFITAVSQEPEDADEHASTFLQRTVTILERLLEGLLTLASLPLAGLQIVGEGLLGLGQLGLAASQAAGEATLAGVSAVGQGIGVLGDGLAAGLHAVGSGAGSLTDAAAAGASGAWQASLDLLAGAFPGEPGEAGQALEDPQARNLDEHRPEDLLAETADELAEQRP